MTRKALMTLSSAWTLVAYLGFVLLAVPCNCQAKPLASAGQAVCCCGPDARTLCAPEPGSCESGKCDGKLGASCAQAVPEATAFQAVASSEGFAPPAAAAMLALALFAPEPSLLAHGRARPPSTSAQALDQVRSTVLRI